MDKHLEDLISDPLNIASLGHSFHKEGGQNSYFVFIRHSHCYGVGSTEKIFITQEEVAYYEEKILLANSTRAKKKLAIKEAKKLRAQEKIDKMEGIKEYSEIEKTVGEDLDDVDELDEILGVVESTEPIDVKKIEDEEI